MSADLVKQLTLQVTACALAAPIKNWAIVARMQSQAYFAIFINSERRIFSIFDIFRSSFWSTYIFKTSLYPCAVIASLQAFYVTRAAQYFYSSRGSSSTSPSLLSRLCGAIGIGKSSSSSRTAAATTSSSRDHPTAPRPATTLANRICDFSFGIAQELCLLLPLFPIDHAHVLLTLDITDGFRKSVLRLFKSLYYNRQRTLWNSDLEVWDRRQWMPKPQLPGPKRVLTGLCFQGIVKDLTRYIVPIVAAHPLLTEVLICQGCDLWKKVSGGGANAAKRCNKEEIVRKYSRVLRVLLAVAATYAMLDTIKATEGTINDRSQPKRYSPRKAKERWQGSLVVLYGDALSVVVDSLPLVLAVLSSS